MDPSAVTMGWPSYHTSRHSRFYGAGSDSLPSGRMSDEESWRGIGDEGYGSERLYGVGGGRSDMEHPSTCRSFNSGPVLQQDDTSYSKINDMNINMSDGIDFEYMFDDICTHLEELPGLPDGDDRVEYQREAPSKNRKHGLKYGWHLSSSERESTDGGRNREDKGDRYDFNRESRSPKGASSPMHEANPACIVCLDSERGTVLLPCAHRFCLECFRISCPKGDSCPICLSSMDMSIGSRFKFLESLEKPQSPRPSDFLEEELRMNLGGDDYREDFSLLDSLLMEASVEELAQKVRGQVGRKDGRTRCGSADSLQLEGMESSADINDDRKKAPRLITRAISAPMSAESQVPDRGSDIERQLDLEAALFSIGKSKNKPLGSGIVSRSRGRATGKKGTKRGGGRGGSSANGRLPRSNVLANKILVNGVAPHAAPIGASAGRVGPAPPHSALGAGDLPKTDGESHGNGAKPTAGLGTKPASISFQKGPMTALNTPSWMSTMYGMPVGVPTPMATGPGGEPMPLFAYNANVMTAPNGTMPMPVLYMPVPQSQQFQMAMANREAYKAYMNAMAAMQGTPNVLKGMGNGGDKVGNLQSGGAAPGSLDSMTARKSKTPKSKAPLGVQPYAAGVLGSNSKVGPQTGHGEASVRKDEGALEDHAIQRSSGVRKAAEGLSAVSSQGMVASRPSIPSTGLVASTTKGAPTPKESDSPYDSRAADSVSPASNGTIEPTLFWERLKPFGNRPAGRYAHAAAMIGNKMYVLGGIFEDKRGNDLHILKMAEVIPDSIVEDEARLRCIMNGQSVDADQAKASWLEDSLRRGGRVEATWTTPETTGTPPSSGCFHQAFAIRDRFFVYGGSVDGKFLTDLHVLEENGDELVWNSVPVIGSPPTMRYWHVTAVAGDRVFCFGGFDGTRLKDLYVLDTSGYFDTGEARWEKVDAAGVQPSVRSAASAVTYGGKIYIFGGFDGRSRKNDVHVLHVGEDGSEKPRWLPQPKILGVPPSVRYNHSAVMYGSRMYVFAGNSGSLKNDLHVLELGAEAPFWSFPRVDAIAESPRSLSPASSPCETPEPMDELGSLTPSGPGAIPEVTATDVVDRAREGDMDLVDGGPPLLYWHSAMVWNGHMLVYGGYSGSKHESDAYIMNLREYDRYEIEPSTHASRRLNASIRKKRKRLLKGVQQNK